MKNCTIFYSIFLVVLGSMIEVSGDHHVKKDESFPFRKVSSSPEVYVCDHFLTDQECDYMIKQSKPKLARSTVVDHDSSKGKIDNRRTSLGMFLTNRDRDKVIRTIKARVASITSIPQKNGEDLQVLYYAVGGEYRPHYDYFDSSTVGGKYHFNRGGQRVATVILYLNTVEEGGETIFPKAHLQISPTKGKALLFYNVDDQGKENPASLHGGSPVLQGEKWIATLWLRERTFQ